MALSPEALPPELLKATGPGEYAAFNAVYGRPTRPIEIPNILALRLVRRAHGLKDYLEGRLKQQLTKQRSQLKR